MYITEVLSKKSSGKVFKTVLLRQSYRENGKVKNKTIANLSSCTEEEINKIKLALGSKKVLASPENIIQGKSVGSVFVIYKVAERLGIVEALGNSFHGKLALWLIIARILEQGSRLSATRLDSIYDLASIIGLERGFDENDFYDCLSWLNDRQQEIENFLFKRRGNTNHRFYWYDVTSSYLEGEKNALAAFGYDRDKKKRKRIIVIGLLTLNEGYPVSIEAFKGNTQDTQTFENQLKKLKKRFGCESITLISDRGLIREKQKKLLSAYGFNYITALPMPQISSLINQGIIKLKDFKNELNSINHENRRYIFRCNPDRALETQRQREERFQTAQRKVNQENLRFEERPKASRYVARRRIRKYLKKLCIFEWTEVSIYKKKLILKKDEEKLKEKAALDGCYIWTTDLKELQLNDQEIYERYKDLKYVEEDFRLYKTTYLEVRPIFVRREESTRGHLVTVFLAHMILRELRHAWKSFNKTVQECLTELSLISRNYILSNEEKKISFIPKPNEEMIALMKAINLDMPQNIEEVKVRVVSRKKTRKNVKI